MPNLGGGDWWQNQAASNITWYPTTLTTSGTSIPYYVQQQAVRQLPSVMEAVAAPITDRDWLDAQIAEVCDLAQAA